MLLWRLDEIIHTKHIEFPTHRSYLINSSYYYSQPNAEGPVFWPPHVKSWLIGKDSDAGRDWGQHQGEGDDRGWDGWMASLTWWMWLWVNSGSWWWTGRPGVLRFMGHKESYTTEWLNWKGWGESSVQYYAYWVSVIVLDIDSEMEYNIATPLRSNGDSRQISNCNTLGRYWKRD